jgi:adenine specific DNA methylase Mod
LKVVLDGVFGGECFRSEINWRRSNAHNDAKQGRKLYGNVRDVIFFYTKSGNWTWNSLHVPYDEDYIDSSYRNVEENTGRRFQAVDLTAAKPGGDTSYEWKGYRLTSGRFWAYSKENMMKFEAEGRLYYTSSGLPRLKYYLDEMPGVSLQNDWQDLSSASKSERLGYPTQKPLALLERIIAASSNPDDVVLDPFCGCGTAVHAAQKLGRQWIGIDITHLAISLIEKRLRDAFPGIEYEVHGTPKDVEGVADLASRDKYQFQWWACSLVGAQPYQGKKKGADSGIDGMIFFQDEKAMTKKAVVSVKGGEHVSVAMIRDLKGVLDREHAQIGLFVTLTEPSKPMKTEAVSAGYYESPHHGKFPRLQILTIEGLMNGKERPEYPDMAKGAHTFKKAQKEHNGAEQESLF